MRRVLYAAIGIGVAGIAYLALRPASVAAIVNVFSSKSDFVKRLWKALDEASMMMNRPEIGAVQKTILIGQAIHEASWGAAKATKAGFNYWNLTAGSRWKGPVIDAPDLEYSDAGTVKKISQRFRKYGSDTEAASDFLRFIGPSTKYEGAYRALIRGSVDDYLSELRAAGFFTQPLETYQSAVRKAIKTVVQIMG